MSFDKELLFKSRLPEAEVEVEGVGTVKVRGLSRAEALEIQKVTGGVAAIERKLLSLAMVDPALTEDEVAQWQRASVAGELDPVTNKVAELSGMNEGADKKAWKEFESDPDSEFRLPPSGQVGPDGGGAGS